MAEAGVSDKFAQVRGFQVEITQATGKEVDTAWESVSSGELMVDTGGDRFRTNSPGHKSVGEVTLRGAMTDGRKALCQWINETVEGKPWRRMITIRPVLLDGTAGETWTFIDCAITGYVPPRMVVSGAEETKNPGAVGPLAEELRFTYREVIVRP